MSKQSDLSLLKQDLAADHMRKAGTLLEQAVFHIPCHLLTPLQNAIHNRILDSEINEQERMILDFYSGHLRYKHLEPETTTT